MRKVWTSSIRVGGCLVLAAICGMLVFSGPALAKGKPVKDSGGKKQKIHHPDNFAAPTQKGTNDYVQPDDSGKIHVEGVAIVNSAFEQVPRAQVVDRDIAP